MPIQIPPLLLKLLAGSRYDGPIRRLCDQVCEVVTSNSGGCYFFPHFTDHGPQHIQDVLESEVELIPTEMRNQAQNRESTAKQPLTAADAAVLIGATLLHDVAMHLGREGFLELVRKGSRFNPIPWFVEAREGHAGDRPWHELWSDFEREGRKLTIRELTDIIGECGAQKWKFEGLPADQGSWQENHRLIVGEFIRRHHARLAHEIALYGFPGLTAQLFPSMGEDGAHPLHEIADLIGLVARSHGVSLRLCKEYLDGNTDYSGSPRPKGSAVLYPMALLRVADYLQIDKQRAPAVLLNLGKPQSPISIREWCTHQAVEGIEPANDQRARMVRVKQKITLPVFLHVQDLLRGIQQEIDHSSAVLDECYGSRNEPDLKNLGLAIRRVRSNLHEAQFQNALPYVPRRISFSTEPRILSLLVEPLYGNHPGVGVRELIQNAVDAVRELKAWNALNPNVKAHAEPDEGWDVLVEFIQQKDGTWNLCVRDRGVGMTPNTLENYFLRAGASFRDSPNWRRDFVDDAGQTRLARSGRFGIGVFAAFLLGDRIKVRTRHADPRGQSGHELEAAHNAQTIEIKRVEKASVGTTAEIPIRPEAASRLGLDAVTATEFSQFHSQVDWYYGTWPRLRIRVVGQGNTIEIPTSERIPELDDALPPEWSVIRPEGYRAVMWSFGEAPRISCNGIKIAVPRADAEPPPPLWNHSISFLEPNVAVWDADSTFPLDLTRYNLTQDLTFLEVLERDIILSFIAHALVCGPASLEEALNQDQLHPLLLDFDHEYRWPDRRDRFGQFNKCTHDPRIWCCKLDCFIPLDPWLCAQCGSRSVFVYADLDYSRIGQESPSKQAWVAAIQMIKANPDGISHWYSSAWCGRTREPESLSKYTPFVIADFIRQGRKGFFELDEMVASHTDNPNVISDEALDAKFWSWQPLIKESDFGRKYYKIFGDDRLSASLINLLEATEKQFIAAALSRNPGDVATFKLAEVNAADGLIAFVAQLKLHEEPQPQSLFARTWNEVLGGSSLFPVKKGGA